jgi:hypothetical protein
MFVNGRGPMRKLTKAAARGRLPPRRGAEPNRTTERPAWSGKRLWRFSEPPIGDANHAGVAVERVVAQTAASASEAVPMSPSPSESKP